MRRAALLVCVALVACAAVEPDLMGPFPADAAAARDRLVEALRDGPVRIEVRDPPPALAAERIASLAASGVTGLSVPFALDGAPPEPRLVLQFGQGDPYELCGRPQPASDAASPLHLIAAFCDGSRTIAALTATAAGPDQRAVERLVWRTTDRLFPDDYQERYGLRLFGDRVRFGLKGEFGF